MIASIIPDSITDFIRKTLVDTKGEVKEVILIIDMINDFLHEKGALYSERHKALVPVMKNFLERKYREGSVFIFCCDAHIKGDETRYPVHAISGSWGAEIIDELKDFCGKERVFTVLKRSPDAFLGTFLQTILEFLKPEKLTVLGVCTDICDKSTVQGAVYRGFNNIKVITDLVATFHIPGIHDGDSFHNAALEEIKGALGVELTESGRV
ncbi:MAG: isochorismatase family cysteine hydrolase [Candidatus Eremiobacterota bacterium]